MLEPMTTNQPLLTGAGRCCRAVLAVALLWLGQPSVAELLTITVLDTQGQPLADAVVELQGAEGMVHGTGSRAMDQVNLQFAPYVLIVQQGQSVSFPNSDNIRHHVYSFSSAKTFEIKLYAAHPGAPLVFDQPGVVVLGCNIHDGMIGYIYVAGFGPVGKTDSEGLLSIQAPPGFARLAVWHPLFTATGRQPIELAPAQLVADGGATGSARYVVTLPVEQVAAGANRDSTANEGDKFLNFELP